MKISSIKGNKQFKSIARKTAAILFWLAVWQCVHMLVRQEILIPSPASVFMCLIKLAQDGSFWLNTIGSLLRVLSGFVAAVVLGTVLAALSHRFKLLYTVVQPAVSVVKATPVASFIILALIWMPSQHMPILISMLMVLPTVYINILEGIRGTDPLLLEMAHIFHVPSRSILMKIYLPSVMPYFFAACTSGMGLAWKAGVAAEVLGNTVNSIGGQIYSSKIYLETVELFAWTVVVILLSVIIEKIVLWLFSRIRYKTDEGGSTQ